jgi:anti-sigma-K factor RskA
MKQPNKPKLDECLAGFVLGELAVDEFSGHSESLTSDHSQMLSELEKIASTMGLASIDPNEPMPDSLRRSVTQLAKSYVAGMNAGPRAIVASDNKNQSGRLREGIAWVACLAATILAIAFWQKSNRDPDLSVKTPLTRESLLTSASDVIQTQWTEGKTPFESDVSGDVIWSNSMQRGFMRFVGMPLNDPKIEQYQLWIIDPSRDDEPIDGGVFDITTTEETIIPIQAKLTVDRPTAFAVTIEKPGGVVVSTQERLPLIAPVKLESKKQWTMHKADSPHPTAYLVSR